MKERIGGTMLKQIGISLAILVGVSFGETICFNNAAELDASFQVIEKGAAGKVQFSPEPGVDGTIGCIELAGIGNTSGKGLYTVASYDLENSPLSVSFCFRAEEYVSNSAFSRVAVGLSPNQKNLLANNEVQVRLLKGKDVDTAVFEVRGAKGGGRSASGVQLNSGQWYRMSVTFKPYHQSSFDVSASLEEVGGKILAEASGIRTASKDFFEGKTRAKLHVGLLVQNDGGGGTALDDVMVSQGSMAE